MADQHLPRGPGASPRGVWGCAVTINQKGDLAFNAEIDSQPVPDDIESNNTRGILT